MSYVAAKHKTISVRVSDKEKQYISNLANKKGQTVTEYVRHTLLSNTGGQSSEERHTSASKELDTILQQLELKDKELSAKNDQIERLHKLLDQQQQLTLSSNQLATDLKKQLDTEQQTNKPKWYQFWRD